MSNKPLASSRTRFLSACHYLAISLLMFGFVPGVWAQPANNTWDTTISFNQTSGGILDLSSTFPGDSVSLNVSMSGAGVNTANADIGGGFDVASYFDVFADVTIPNSVNYLDTPISGPFSITQPVGPRPSVHAHRDRSRTHPYGSHHQPPGRSIVSALLCPVSSGLGHGLHRLVVYQHLSSTLFPIRLPCTLRPIH